jgi:HAD superfamily hydrolase (TIGR01509 family)
VSRFDLVIFDCDGVLVDSERIAIKTESETMTALGWPLTEADIVDLFVGRSVQYMQAEVERHIGRPVDWAAEVEPRYYERLQRELVAVAGVVDALDRISITSCVASSGSHQKMRYTLGLTGLWERFAGRIFSADDVAHGKPAPDVFLHAARCMGVAPPRCAVIEDSSSGVTAAMAAGMSVFAFAGGVTPAAKLRRRGVVVFDDMSTLPELLLAA